MEDKCKNYSVFPQEGNCMDGLLSSEFPDMPLVDSSHKMQMLTQQSDWCTPQCERAQSLSHMIFARSIFILPTCQNRHTSHRPANFYFTDVSEPSHISLREGGYISRIFSICEGSRFVNGKNNQNWSIPPLPSIFARKAAVCSGCKIVRKIKCFIYKRAKLC